MSENQIKGGVIIIGSLLWEDHDNCLSRDKGRLREIWRTNLNLNAKREISLPVRYGRSSPSRKCTYTMVLSREFLGGTGKGLLVPYNSENFNFNEFNHQIKLLAEAEGIFSKNEDVKYSKPWGAVSILIKSTTNEDTIRGWWNKIIESKDNGYEKDTANFNWKRGDETKLINDQYILDALSIDTELDFLLLTYVKPQHKNIAKNKEEAYPTPKEIADEMLSAGYQIYFCQNRANGIVTQEDDKIIKNMT